MIIFYLATQNCRDACVNQRCCEEIMKLKCAESRKGKHISTAIVELEKGFNLKKVEYFNVE